MPYLKLTSTLLLGVLVLTSVNCGTEPAHPNQINAFDGASYDSLTLAHAALASLRTAVSSDYPQYIPMFNQANASYSLAYTTYAAFRTQPSNPAAVRLALSGLTARLVSLESTFQQSLHVSALAASRVRARAAGMRTRAQNRLTISDVLTELEIAATIAESVPGTEPYSMIAALVIKATQDAVASLQASSAKAIDLATIQPFASIE